MWGPTHLMLIGGAGMCLIGQAILLAEGMQSRSSAAALSGRTESRLRGSGPGSLVTWLRRMGLMGGLLIGLSEAMAGLFFAPSAKSMFGIAILILVLLFRPQGLLGRRA